MFGMSNRSVNDRVFVCNYISLQIHLVHSFVNIYNTNRTSKNYNQRQSYFDNQKYIFPYFMFIVRSGSLRRLFDGYDYNSPDKIYIMSGMKGESLLSNISNLSYHLEAGVYVGSDFFKDSILGASKHKNGKSKPQQEVGIDSLAMSALGNINAGGEPVGAFTMCWTNDGKNVQGVSDEQVDIEKSPNQVKQEEEPRYPEPFSLKREEQNPERDNQSQSQLPKTSKFKNETKNIPKNYGKAIIIFIEKNKDKLASILESYNTEYFDLVEELQQRKKTINTIADLRKMWVDSAFSNVMRVISNLFMRKHSLQYIFNSRIKSRQCHIKYKKRLEEALTNPSQFQHIKDY